MSIHCFSVTPGSLTVNDARHAYVIPQNFAEELYCLFCRYASNTRVKLILVVDEIMPKDEEMRLVSLACMAYILEFVLGLTVA